MVSDVDDVVSSKPKQPQKPHAEAPPKQTAGGSQQPKQTSTKPTSQTYQAPAQPSGDSSAGKWFVGIAVVIGLIWLANQSENSRPSKPAYSPELLPLPQRRPANPQLRSLRRRVVLLKANLPLVGTMSYQLRRFATVWLRKFGLMRLRRFSTITTIQMSIALMGM